MMPSQSLNGQFAHVGVAAYLPKPAWRTSAGARELAELLVDERWPWAPWWMSFSGKHRRDDAKSVRVGGKQGSSLLERGLLSDKLARLYMNRTKGDGNFTSVTLNLDNSNSAKQETPYELLITCRCAELPRGKTFAAFLSLTHDLLVRLGALQGVIGAWPTYDWAICDTWLTRMVLDTPRGDINLGLPQSFEQQRSLASWWKPFFGQTYARHPRWGTYLNTAHLAAIGGLERVQAEVEPAVISPLGELTYLQLTSSIETAMSPKAEQKRQALEGLMAPILPGAPRSTPTSPPSPP